MSGTVEKRKCSNWLDTFLEWTFSVSEAPESFLLWSGLFCPAAVLKRRVRYSKKLVKQWDIYPTSYIMFVAPPGVAKKSTTAGLSEKLIMKYNGQLKSGVTDPGYVNFGPTSGSEVAMIDAMSNALDGSMSIIAGEFGNIVKTRPMETYDFFTKMFDNDPTYVHSIMSSKGKTVLEPSFNILGCTTPDWMSMNTSYITGGGFAARTIFVFEQKSRQRKLFDVEITEDEHGVFSSQDIGPSLADMTKLEESLIHDLTLMSKVKGEARPATLKLAKRMNDWYVQYVDLPVQKGEETFQQRKHVHTLRTAMLLSICERDDLLITEEHFDQALKMIEYVEKRLSRGFATTGRNPYSGSYYQVLEYIETKERVKRGEILAYFFNDIDPLEMEKILVVLKAAGEVEFLINSDEYRVKK